MVYVVSYQNPQFGYNLEGLQMESVGIAILWTFGMLYLWPFGMFYGHLVCFTAIW
jgi:hypothetical protein